MSGDGANATLAAALHYAARGWHVLPLQPGGKQPLGLLAPRGLLDATTDTETIRQWWTTAPDANVGIRTGATSGFVVLDVDPRHQGDDSLWELQSRHAKLPDTIMALTGGGGSHWLFAHPGQGVVIRNATNLGGLPGLDVRGDGGYIVAPPSWHPNGRRYEWEVCSHPDDIPLAPMPAWLLALLRLEVPRTKPAAPGLAAIADGTRNATLTSLAGTMRRRGMSQEAIVAGLLAENERRCIPPLSKDEVERLAASVSRYEPAALPQAEKSAKGSQATRLVELVDGELFHTPEGLAFVTFTEEGHRETWLIQSSTFRSRLVGRSYGETKTAPTTQALQDALAVLAGRALFDGPVAPVFIRAAGHEGAIYVDLGTPSWAAIKVTPAGWEVVADPPVRFRRTRGMAPLPHPERGGTLDELRPFVNVAREDDWVLLVAWLLMALHTTGPYPILLLHGEQGSAKSTTARVARALVDPSTIPLRAEPRDVRDVMIAASNARCLAFDNLSSVPFWLSDALCRLSTGGGFATRELFTDRDEILFEAQRPVILNGIEELATHGDLLDRVLMLDLPAIPTHKRRTETEFWGAFEQAQPWILGALLDAVAGALRDLPGVRLLHLPRMADFAVWATAAETAVGFSPGTFQNTYMRSREQSDVLALDASIVAAAVRALAARGEWQGTATELLEVLADQTAESVRRQRAWPATPRALTNALRRLIPNLRAAGIQVEFRRRPGGARPRTICIRVSPPSSVPIVPSVPSGERRQDQSHADAGSSPGLATPPNPSSGTERDDGDARTLPRSGADPESQEG